MTALVPFDVEATSRQVTMLAEYFNAPLEPHVLRLYIDALRDVPADHLRMGCKRLITTARFMPKVADIRAAIDAEFAERRRVEAHDTPPTREVVCTNCEDNGWVFVESKPHAGPTVRRCPCYTTNPKLVEPKRFSPSEDHRR